MPSHHPDSAPEPPRHGVPALPPELDPRGRRRGRHGGGAGNGRRNLRRSTQVLASVLSVALLVGFAYGWWSYRKLNSNLQRLTVAVGNDGGGSNAPARHDIDGKDQNILIAGNDNRTGMTDAEVRELKVGRDGGSLATDTMMIVHIPANGAKATLISMPRDSYVTIPGHGMNRLNAAFALAYSSSGGSDKARSAAGANLLIKSVENLTGITIDHFVQVDLLGFYRISTAIGGISVNMCHSVDDAQYSHFVISAGKHHLTPLQTLEFVRQRHQLNGGDLDRVKRQQYFLTAAFRQIASAGTLLNPGRLNKLISAVHTSVYVDQNIDLTTLAEQLTNLNADDIVSRTIPTNGGEMTGVGDVLSVNPVEVKTFIAKLIGEDNSALAKARAVDPAKVPVDVVNGGTIDGAATRNAAILRQAGFQTSVDQKGASSSATVIEYASGMESQAKTLAAYVPGASYQKVDSIGQVTLLLGADGLSAKPVAKSSTSSSPTAGTSSSPKPKSKSIDAGCIN